MATKTCPKCETEKDIQDFDPHGRSKDGHKAICRVCTVEASFAGTASQARSSKKAPRRKGGAGKKAARKKRKAVGGPRSRRRTTEISAPAALTAETGLLSLLRVGLFTAAQTLEGDELAELWATIEDLILAHRPQSILVQAILEERGQTG